METNPNDIVFVCEGRKIFSKYSTPRQLGLEDDCELCESSHSNLLLDTHSGLVGYYKSYWEQKEKRDKEERYRLIHGSPPPEEQGSLFPPITEAPAEPAKTRVCLRGTWGSFKVNVAAFVHVTTLTQVYCAKASKDASLAKGLKLQFDGDTLSPETTVGDLDMEDGDIIDVEV